MKGAALTVLAVVILCVPVSGSTVLFDFNSGPQFTSLPLDLTVGGVTAHLSATGSGFSIQNTAQVIGMLPLGFTGLGLTPNSVFGADLLVSFPGEVVTDFSIMVAPQELNTDSTATMRVSAFMNGLPVGTNTSQGSEPFLWPSSTLSFSSPQGFNSVVIHYASPPPTGGDYGVIFVADNMMVTTAVVPEPTSAALLGIGAVGMLLLGFGARACPRIVGVGKRQSANVR